MEHDSNHLGQPIGRLVADWHPPPRPSRAPLEGRYCRLEPLDAARLNGCGLVVVNPPFGFEDAMRTLLPALKRRMLLRWHQMQPHTVPRPR